MTNLKYILALEKAVREGERYPRGYGFAYMGEPWLDHKVAYPIPLNLVVRWARAAWIWIMVRVKPMRMSWYERRFMRAYHAGRVTGISQRDYLADEKIKIVMGFVVVLMRDDLHLLDILGRMTRDEITPRETNRAIVEWAQQKRRDTNVG